eukprot:Selendium_serpulae@DN3958_c0_g1_i2.p1
MGCSSSKKKDKNSGAADLVLKSPAQRDWEANEELIKKETIKRKKTEARAKQAAELQATGKPDKQATRKQSSSPSERRKSSVDMHAALNFDNDDDEYGGNTL